MKALIGARTRRLVDQLDDDARHILDEAWDEAERLGDNAVGTEYLLIALATSHPDTARLLATAGVTATELHHTFITDRGPRRRPDDQTLQATLGVDLAAVRERAARTFGSEALSYVALRARPRQPRRRLRTYISCSRPLPPRRSESPLAGRRLEPIPRVTRLLRRAVRRARPRLASPADLLLVLLEGNEPAVELLTARGVDASALVQSTRRWTRRRAAFD
jgi:ATP-dependent Clp protease ATP-binding subunit ClpA